MIGGTATTGRKGLTLVEVVVALSILGGVMLTLGSFTMRLSQSTSGASIRVTAGQLASDRLETIKGAPTYVGIDSYVGTESSISNYPGYSRQTWVQHVGGGPSDTTDYRVVTVQVQNAQLADSVRKTTVIAAY